MGDDGTLLFCSLKLLGPGDLRKEVCLGSKTLYYAKFWAQNATKTSAGNIPESLSNLFLRDNCRLLQMSDDLLKPEELLGFLENECPTYNVLWQMEKGPES